MNDIDTLSKAITKAIGYAENGGHPNVNNVKAGRTGELKSIFQFTPSTWKLYSKQIFGKEVPLSADNETYVVNEKVKNWLKSGYKPEQIASMWNAGEREPDAYTGKFSNGQSSVGINKQYNVKFDVPKYANKVANYTNAFYKEMSQNHQPSQQISSEVQSPIQDQGQDPVVAHKEAINDLLAIIARNPSSQKTSYGLQSPQNIPQRNQL